ncbi:MAG: FtsX-like permease family protein, partial [Muribaculaceae bacterium]|nr:FtsX-like permease family protein [Muribaculaceae bacterium]
QQRVGEIAIRKVCGASKGAVFTRIISEGILLLVCAGLISIAVVFFTVRYGSIGYMEFQTPAPIILSGIVTILLVGSGVVLSIGYPAWRAMRIEPAIAVKSE